MLRCGRLLRRGNNRAGASGWPPSCRIIMDREGAAEVCGVSSCAQRRSARDRSPPHAPPRTEEDLPRCPSGSCGDELHLTATRHVGSPSAKTSTTPGSGFGPCQARSPSATGPSTAFDRGSGSTERCRSALHAAGCRRGHGAGGRRGEKRRPQGQHPPDTDDRARRRPPPSRSPGGSAPGRPYQESRRDMGGSPIGTRACTAWARANTPSSPNGGPTT